MKKNLKDERLLKIRDIRTPKRDNSEETFPSCESLKNLVFKVNNSISLLICV
jgi:hypothetical protein